jgi:hypothetical protein
MVPFFKLFILRKLRKRSVLASIASFITLAVLLPTATIFAQSNPSTAPLPTETASWIHRIILHILWIIVVNVFGTWVWLTGIALNYSLGLFVIGFGDQFIESGLGANVDNMWRLVRDLFNLTFIFGLVYLGLKMILNSDDSSTKRNIIFLILAALLVNFSLFFTKFIIDFTNVTATTILNNIDRVPTMNITSITGATIAVPDIAGRIAQLLNLSSVLSGGDSTPAFGSLAASSGYAYIVFVAIFLLVTGYVFISGALLILARFIALNFFLIFSPVMFLGWVFPNFETVSRKYWREFLGRAFFAPIYVLLIYIVLILMAGYYSNRTLSPTSNATIGLFGQSATAGSATQEFMNLVVPFLMMTGLMIAALNISKRLGADGANTAISIGDNLQKRGRRFVTRNTAGAAYRMTVGNTATALNTSLNRGLGRMAQGGALSRATARTLERTVGSGLQAAAGVSIAGAETVEQRRKRVREQQNRFNTSAQASARAATTQSSLERARANTADDPVARAARNAALTELASQVRRMSNDEVLNLDRETLMSPEVAQHLTDAHITALRESGIYTNDQAREISTRRDQGTFDVLNETLNSITADATELGTALQQLAQTVERLPIDRLQSFTADPSTANQSNSLLNQRIAANLTDTQLTALQNSGRFSAAQMTQIRAARTAGLTAIASGAAPNIVNTGNANAAAATENLRRNLFQERSAQEAGRLPATVYMQTDMAQYITPNALQQRVRNGLSAQEIADIETNIQDYINDPATPNRVTTMWQNWARNTTEGSQFNF